MHVSILAGLLLTSSAYNEHKARVAAPFHQLVRVGIVEAHETCGAKERTARQRCKLFARDFLSGVGLTCLHSRLMQRSACHATPRRGTSLRGVCDSFFAFSQNSRSQCLSGGATRHTRLPVGAVHREHPTGTASVQQFPLSRCVYNNALYGFI